MASNNFLFPPTLPSLASAPGSPANGMGYYDTTLGVYRVYTNGAWYSLNPNFSLNVTIVTPSVSTVSVIGYVNTACTLTGVKRAKTAAGTVTCTLVVNGSTTITGFTGISTSSTDSTISQALAVGDYLELSISAVSSPSFAKFTLIGTKT